MWLILPIKEIKNCICLSIITLLLLSCQNVGQRNSGSVINRDAELVLQNLFEIDPDTVSIYKNAPATLIIPRITKAGLVLGGAYGAVSYTHLTLPTSDLV